MAYQIWACGLNYQGQCGNSLVVQLSSPIVVNTQGWQQMPSFGNSMGAIGYDGNIYVWGQNNNGQLGKNDTANASSPIQLTSDGSWSQISIFTTYTLALKNDGTIWSCGANTAGQLGVGDKINRSSLVQIGSSNDWAYVRAMPVANACSALKKDGTLWSWGSNALGCFGNNSTVSVSSPIQIGNSSDWTQLGSGRTGLAIKSDGTLWVTGDAGYGNTGLNNTINISSWAQLGSGTDWATCSMTQNGMATKKNGTLYVWGPNGSGQLGNNSVTSRSSPIQVAGSWSMVASTYVGYIALKTDGTLWAWGDNVRGQLGTSNLVSRSVPAQILSGKNIVSIGSTWQQMYVQAMAATPSPSPTPSPTPTPTLNNYNLYGWGQNGATGLVGNNSTINVNSPVLVMSSVDPFCATTGKSSALLKYGQLYTWGRSASGESGRNTTVAALSPVLVGLENNWVFVCTGYNCGGIKSDGSLWMWGTGANGCIGDGVVVSRSSPVQIAGTWSVVRTTSFSSPFNTVAIRSNGTLWAWGDNSIGQLGQNDLISRSSPVQIGTANNYIDCAYLCVGLAFPFQTSLIVALRSDGTLWAVGNGSYEGRTGTGVLTNYSSITQVGTSTDWAFLSGTTNTVGAIKKDGTLWMWGTGPNGALGTGNVISRSSPTQVGTGTDWVEVQCNYYNSFARKSDGTIWSWGLGSVGSLGNGTANRSSPAQIGTNNNFWLSIGGGEYTSFGIRIPDQTPTPSPSPSPTPLPSPTAIAGQLYVWGDNANGQLGLNIGVVDKSTPVQLASLSWSKISMDSMFAGLTTAGTIWGCGSNFSGNLGVNNTNNYSSLIQIGTAGVWTDITTGSLTLHAIRNNGTLWGCGNNSTSGTVGNNSAANLSSLVQIGSATDWTRLAENTNAGSRFAWRGNSLFAWGYNINGNLGINTVTNVSSPVLVDSSGLWSTICTAGATYSIGVKTDGTLWVTGSNVSGQLGLGNIVNRSSWTQVGSGTDWATASAAYDTAFAIKKNGTLYAWGTNASGQVAQGNTSPTLYSSPVQIGTGTDWVNVIASSNSGRAIKTNGTLWGWGSNSDGVLGTNASLTSFSSPVQTVYQSSWAADFGGGLNSSFGFIVGPAPTTSPSPTASPTMSPSPTPSNTPSPTPSGSASPTPTFSPSPTPSPSPSPSFTPAPTTTPINNVNLWVWGDNNYGIFGNNSSVQKYSPIFDFAVNNWHSLNYSSQLAYIDSSDRLWICGANFQGQVGDGTTVNRSSLIQLAGSNWRQIMLGNTTNYAFKTDGTLWAWGSNFFGSIGDNTVIDKSSPVQVGTDIDWFKIIPTNVGFSAGTVFAFKLDGNLYAWGNNISGQLGLNNAQNISSPTLISTSKNWKNIGSGAFHTLVVKNDGSLWVSGRNAYGQLGNNSVVWASSWIQIGSENTWSSVTCGPFNSFALKTDGTIWSWGKNTAGTDTGQLGLGDTIDRSSPCQIGTLNTWVSIDAYVSGAVAMDNTGRLWNWGYNFQGQCGIGNNVPVYISSPVQTSLADQNWLIAFAGNNSTAALRIPPPTVTPSPSPSLSPTNTPSPTPSRSPSPTPSPSPTSSPSPTPSKSPSPTPSPSASPTPSPTNSPSPTPSPSPSPSPSPTATPFPSQSPFPTFTPQPTQSPQPTFTPQPTLSPVPTVTPFPTTTPDPTPTGSPTPLPTDTPQPTLTPVPTVTPFPTLTPLPTFTPFPTLTPQATPVYPTTNNYILVPYQNNMNVTNIVPSQEGYAFNNGGGAGINLLLQFMQNDPTPQQVYIELTNNSSVDMVITIGSLVYVIEPGTYFNTTALMPFGQKVTVQSSESATFTPSSVYGQIFILPTPTPTPAEILKLQRNIIAVEGDAGSVDTGLINGTSIQRTGYITITENVTQVKVMEIPDGGIIDKTIQQIPAVIPLVCSGYLWVGDL